MSTHRGKIHDGAIVLSEPVALPEGMEVIVNIAPVEASECADTNPQTDNAMTLPFIGIWADHEDMSDSAAWVRKEREAWSQRRHQQG